jgi:hypothetical protein
LTEFSEGLPAGFKEHEWYQFNRDGFMLKKSSINAGLIGDIKHAVDAVYYKDGYDGKSMNLRSFILDHPVFSQLIDHNSYIAYMYDVYGDSLTLLMSNLIIRQPQQASEERNSWHFDGPRINPFKAYSPRIPLRIKVGIALTDCQVADAGNLIVLPQSHRTDMIPEYQTHLDRPDQLQVKMKAGDVIFMYEGLWHRVASNQSEQPRKVIYLEYGPAWIRSGDRFKTDPKDVTRLSRSQKIIMRPYVHANHFIKIPESDVPLFPSYRGRLKSDSVIPLSLQRQKLPIDDWTMEVL